MRRTRSRSLRPLKLRPASAGPRPDLDPFVLQVLSYRRPRRIPEAPWVGDFGEFVRSHFLRLDVEAGPRTESLLADFAHICWWWHGIKHRPLDIELILDPDTVEQYSLTALPNRNDAGVAKARCNLRSLGEVLTKTAPWEPPPAPFSRTKLPEPYLDRELRILRRDAGRQPLPWLCQAAKAFELLGLGAGLDGRWVSKIHGTDVRQLGLHVVVDVPSPQPRRVTVRDRYAVELLELAKVAGTGRLDGAPAGTVYESWRVVELLVFDGGRLEFSPGRLRSTWLVAHLCAGTRVPELLAAAGLETATGFRDLLKFVPRLREDAARDELGRA